MKMMSVHRAQTEILRWLESRGHVVDHSAEYGAEPRPTFKERSCERKKRFETEGDARAFAPHLERYRCRFCNGWHNATPR